MIRPEDKLLLCCARKNIDPKNKDKILALTQKTLNWDYLLKLAAKHKLNQLLYFQLNSICPERVPDKILDQLRDDFQGNAHNNLLLTGELIKILEEFDSNGICAIHYKGPSLALLAYDSLSLRQFVDIDIIVNKLNTKKVTELMIMLGYRLESYPKGMDESLYFETQTEHKFINKKSKVVVEIHNKVQGHFFYLPDNHEFLYRENSLKILEINNYPIKTFSIENYILLLCIHCARHDWSRISWICDIFELAESHEINWQEVIKQAEKLYVKRILLVSLFLTSDLLGLKLSNEILSILHEDPHVEKISKQVKKRMFMEVDFDIFERTALDLKKRESLKLSLRDVITTMFTPTYVDFEDFPLPSSLFYFYYLIRPILLLKRY